MKVIKKYTAIQLDTETVNDNVVIKLSFGKITGPYYSITSPTEDFETEEEAYIYSYKTNKWGRWLIIPIVKFNNYDID